VYDLVRYDALHPILHDEKLLSLQKQAYDIAKPFARIVQPMEFGTNQLNRRSISSLIAHDLLIKISECVNHPGLDLFFVSESHIQAIINLFVDKLNYPDYENIVDFMAHLILKVYKNDTDEYRLEVFLSNGSYQNPFKMEFGVPRIQNAKLIGDNYSVNILEEMLDQVENCIVVTKERLDLGYDVLTQNKNEQK